MARHTYTHGQSALPLTVAQACEGGDFFISSANAGVAGRLKEWSEDVKNALPIVLSGPKHSGKTRLLARIMRERPEAYYVRAGDMPDMPPAASLWIIDATESARDEQILFHWINAARETGARLALAGAEGHFFSLPDLQSRMLSFERLSLPAPDKELLEAILAERFAARQMRVSSAALRYIAARLDRRYDAPENAARALDAASLARGGAVTPSLAKETLGF